MRKLDIFLLEGKQNAAERRVSTRRVYRMLMILIVRTVCKYENICSHTYDFITTSSGVKLINAALIMMTIKLFFSMHIYFLTLL